MRRRLLALFLTATALCLSAAPVAAQTPVPRHLHFLTTPSGNTHAIAGGLTFHAPCVAFLNFHEIVHNTVFGTGGTGTLKNPNGPLAAQVQPQLGSCTP
jgi:hypothetical protein